MSDLSDAMSDFAPLTTRERALIAGWEAEVERLREKLRTANRIRAERERAWEVEVERLHGALREWLAADDAAEADFSEQAEARLEAAVANARALVPDITALPADGESR